MFSIIYFEHDCLTLARISSNFVLSKLEDKGEDISQKVEAEQIGDVLDNDLCFQIVNELKQEHNEGIQKTIAMKNVMKKYNINQVELLEYMKLYIQIQEEKVAETEPEI